MNDETSIVGPNGDTTHHQTQKKDIKFVPITINYDRVYEGDSFPLELLGEAKQYESVYRALRQFIHINAKLGRVHIKYCTPISLKDYI